MAKKIFCIFLIMFAGICAGNGKTMKLKKSDQHKLKKMLAGNYNNEIQANENKNFPHTLLHIQPIWEDEINGCWFYVEQNLAASPDHALNQMVYYVYKKNDTTTSLKIYTLQNAAQVAGAWRDAAKVSSIVLDSLSERQGCAVNLIKRSQKVYSGHTDWGTCVSHENGSTYASTEMVIYKRKLVMWERAWNDKDKQVWGPVQSGYSFIKKKK